LVSKDLHPGVIETKGVELAKGDPAPVIQFAQVLLHSVGSGEVGETRKPKERIARWNL
jgi:hypothetical protein